MDIKEGFSLALYLLGKSNPSLNCWPENVWCDATLVHIN